MTAVAATERYGVVVHADPSGRDRWALIDLDDNDRRLRSLGWADEVSRDAAEAAASRVLAGWVDRRVVVSIDRYDDAVMLGAVRC